MARPMGFEGADWTFEVEEASSGVYATRALERDEVRVKARVHDPEALIARLRVDADAMKGRDAPS